MMMISSSRVPLWCSVAACHTQDVASQRQGWLRMSLIDWLGVTISVSLAAVETDDLVI
ncbi:uncharacterized protein BCR38DRAFT_446033 [Pseudomassariella vexata]|uniref:Uncharacterized protein n=1 Tax=Pseudomassariella vexata TaxID=1141098 RepID=A0A1Y2DJ77_9PEZI|nr:uncharacterized protein BCR38DRAFT_446033 [Pseudomassariella vexata]ORY59259.1 hypothetical protein BCR38DRAFT_446033 [Pseudomassariella vexata]